MFIRLLTNFVVVLVVSGSLYTPAPTRTADSSIGREEFGRLIATLSEPEGYFDSDNFVSNEAAYLQILPALKRMNLSGGAYLGVGPDQNYSYIAEIRPSLAFIIDIRRQNALQHLYYKALFQRSDSRARYVERLFGRRLSGVDRNSTIGDLLGAVDQAPVSPEFSSRKVAEALETVRSWKLRLSAEDYEAIRYVAAAFMEGGPDLKFTSHNRAPRPHHPTYRSLLAETDPAGVQSNYLGQEERFKYVKDLHDSNRIIPVVGDVGGSKALQDTAREIRSRGLALHCFYVSNVEFYLFRGDRWTSYTANLRTLPWGPKGCLIRSYANMWQPHPAQLYNSYMSTILQPYQAFSANETAGRNRTYWDLVTRDYIAR